MSGNRFLAGNLNQPADEMSSEPNMAFHGHHALVTGAAQGVGRAVAELFARRGASVLAIDVSPQVKELTSDTVRTQVVDLGDPEQTSRLADRLASGPTVDILVNAAAAYPGGGILATTDEQWRHVTQVNVLAAVTLSRAVAHRLVDTGQPGSIVNVGSVQQALPLPGYSAYVTSKGALNSLTSALAVELGPHQIRVNEVTLSLIDSTSLRDKLGDTFAADKPPPPTLLGRVGSTEEAAEAILFLASARASFITGAVLAVDGGRRLSRQTDPQLDPPDEAGRPA